MHRKAMLTGKLCSISKCSCWSPQTFTMLCGDLVLHHHIYVFMDMTSAQRLGSLINWILSTFLITKQGIQDPCIGSTHMLLYPHITYLVIPIKSICWSMENSYETNTKCAYTMFSFIDLCSRTGWYRLPLEPVKWSHRCFAHTISTTSCQVAWFDVSLIPRIDWVRAQVWVASAYAIDLSNAHADLQVVFDQQLIITIALINHQYT